MMLPETVNYVTPTNDVTASNDVTAKEFGRYTIHELLGSGGQASIYKAFDPLLDRWVALKRPNARFAGIPDVYSAVIEEARMAARFSHSPNFCKVYDSGVINGTPYLSLEYIEGKNLSNFLKFPWMVPGPREAVELVRVLALALDEFHKSKGTPIHRDLKPGNVMLTNPPERRPVLIDFGLALRLNSCDSKKPGKGDVIGTVNYMPPEQLLAGNQALCHASDVYSLGVILFELLTGQTPFAKVNDLTTLMIKVENTAPPKPSQLKKQSLANWFLNGFSRRQATINQTLDEICLKALAKDPRDRFRDMLEFASALEQVNFEMSSGSTIKRSTAQRPLVAREAIRFAFAGLGEHAPGQRLEGQNRLFLDVGNDLRTGVIDHHQVVGDGGTARMILSHPDLIDAAVAPGGTDAFTIVLHTDPDLDCVVSSYFAIAYLTTGKFPQGNSIEELIAYTDRVDSGHPGMSLSNPFTLYAAQQQLSAHYKNLRGVERWQATVTQGLVLVDYLLQMMDRDSKTVDSIDAFACPGMFSAEDRADVRNDPKRYKTKLADPKTCARVAQLKLPGQFGREIALDALLVRDVQNLGDEDRVRYFKIWARSDDQRSPQKRGFEALSVYSNLDGTRPPRCILSVTPGSNASLCELGSRLEVAEAAVRTRLYGADDRKVDPVTGKVLSPRPGYDNEDPWYDGRSHNYTIVDSPRRGTLLSANEIEQIFLDFGKGHAVSLKPSPMKAD